MTDWIEHTGDTCPVDPETVVEVRYRGEPIARSDEARFMGWHRGSITHYRILTPAKPPEPEEPFAPWDSWPKRSSEALPSEPDLINLRLECLKLAVNDHFYEAGEPDYEKVADRFLHYVLNGSVDKA